MRASLTVLMYHRVLPDGKCEGYPFPSLVLSRTLFEAQLEYLSEHAHVLPLREALQRYRSRQRGSKPLVCLTFDDGYVDNFEIVAPLLESRGLRGTFFITAGAVESRNALWYDRAAELWAVMGPARQADRSLRSVAPPVHVVETRESWIEWLKSIPNRQRVEFLEALEAEASNRPTSCSLMTVDQVRRLDQQGHEIGSHTLSHPVLTTMGEAERVREIVGSRELLQGWTDREVKGFCYANGDFDAAIIRQVRDAGYEYACTTLQGRNHMHTDPFALRRVDATADRIANTEGRFDVLAFRAEISLLHEALRRGP